MCVGGMSTIAYEGHHRPPATRGAHSTLRRSRVPCTRARARVGVCARACVRAHVRALARLLKREVAARKQSRIARARAR